MTHQIPDFLIGNNQLAISLPRKGGYALHVFADGAWRMIHSDMPQIILDAKCSAVYADLCDGLLPVVALLPELDALVGPAPRAALRQKLAVS